MAKKEDVVVRSRWQWVDDRTPRMWRRRPFVVVCVEGGRAIHYVYEGTSVAGCRAVDFVVDHAELLSPCKPGCGPGDPCKASSLCPGARPEYTGADGYKAWSEEQCPGLDYPIAPRREIHEPMRSGSGTLGCNWILRRLRD